MIKHLLACHSKIERGFVTEYRLTTGPPDKSSGAFPTALVDAVAGYAYLVRDLGFKPENIIVAGDSAGGNLALALTRYLIDLERLAVLPQPLPLPSGLLLISPWGDLGTSHDTPTSSHRTNLASDFLLAPDAGLLLHARKHFMKDLGFPAAGNSNPYISPASAHPDLDGISFKGFPKTFITCGGGEILRDMIHTLKNKMVAKIHF